MQLRQKARQFLSSALLKSDNCRNSVEEVNKYFTSIGERLAENLPVNTWQRYKHQNSNPIILLAFLSTDEGEIEHIVMGLKETSTARIDEKSA